MSSTPYFFAKSRSCFVLIFDMLFAAPLRPFVFPFRFAAKAAPAALLCFPDLAGMTSSFFHKVNPALAPNHVRALAI